MSSPCLARQGHSFLDPILLHEVWFLGVGERITTVCIGATLPA